ncbi:PhoX domain-containing protein [Suillus bovinus]|uniref:PhoX domain-containing protein n=1 Tax=Suillus bovinus TaxID=48563 RepID=UPI001B8734B3|nr:PhoX domain-containing protein [Suillus bovinus]KAG2156578.1 PhoX domain-containing protein [Suillus bovinus]
MHSFISARSALAVAFLAVVFPVVARAFSSPIYLILLSPVIILFVAVSCFIVTILVGVALDKKLVHRNALTYAARPLAFSTPAAWQAVLTRSNWSQKTPQSLSPLYPELPVVSSTLNDIMIFVVRDFVLTWYKDISSSPSFPTAVSSMLHDSLERLLQTSTTVDLSALLVKRILPKVTTHIEQFRQSEVALRGAALERRLTQSEELDMLLASRYAGKGGKLHPAVENLSSTFTKQNEEIHLRTIAERILSHVLPEQEAHSKALRIVVREILVCTVLYPIMDMVSDPDFWNRMIEQVAGAAIHQQKLISQVRNVLEAQSPRRHSRLPSAISTGDTITVRTDMRQFESFLRSINRCSSLLDARRLKNDIMGEIRRTRLLLANHEKEDWISGEKTEDVVAFLDRLYTAKRTVEQRIVVLGGEDSKSAASPESGSRTQVTLRDILSNPTSLSYFMEFMDRRHRSLLVQFWLTVESFKNPLESIDSSSSGDEDEPLQGPSTSSTLKEDISMINDLYFSVMPPHPALSSISKRHIDSIRSYAQSDFLLGPLEDKKVRRSVMLAQRQVQQAMEQDFEDLQRSELWFRIVEDFNRASAKLLEPPAGRISGRSMSPQPLPLPASRSLGIGSVHIFRSESSPSLSSVVQRVENPRTSSTTASRTNIDVLMSPVSDTSSTTSRAPLFDDPDDAQGADEAERMRAIQAALTDIIATEQLPHSFLPRGQDRGGNRHLSATSLDNKKGIFGDDEDMIDEEDDDRAEGSVDTKQGTFQLAGPGDLQLSYEIERLGDKIAKLEAHDVMLDTLIKKAELTGDAQELRLLQKSKSSMTRELRELRFQKIQYEQQESANRLISHRTKVSIVSSTVGEEEGKSVVRYLVEVQQLAPDGTFASGWVVARRYNEFLRMHNKLRDRYALVKGLDFPGKRLVASLTGSFVDTRRQALEKYLQNLIAIHVVCESNDLRAFLSRDSPFIASEVQDDVPKGTAGFSGKNLVRSVYRSVAESIDDMFFGPSMLDVMIQRLTRQAAEFAGIVGSAVHDEDLVAQALKAFGKSTSEDTFMHMSSDLRPLEGETSTSTFSAPICDLVLAIFELNKKDNWLRRQAIVIILQQVLGGTIERQIRQSIKSLFEESRIMPILTFFKDSLWPGGKLKPPGQPRSTEEITRSRDGANRKLSALVPDLAANMIGRSNARRGARRIFAVLQNKRLNQHIAYTIVDEVVAAMFPEPDI